MTVVAAKRSWITTRRMIRATRVGQLRQPNHWQYSPYRYRKNARVCQPIQLRRAAFWMLNRSYFKTKG